MEGEGVAVCSLLVLYMDEDQRLGSREQGSPGGIAATHLTLQVQKGGWFNCHWCSGG